MFFFTARRQADSQSVSQSVRVLPRWTCYALPRKSMQTGGNRDRRVIQVRTQSRPRSNLGPWREHTTVMRARVDATESQQRSRWDLVSQETRATSYVRVRRVLFHGSTMEASFLIHVTQRIRTRGSESKFADRTSPTGGDQSSSEDLDFTTRDQKLLADALPIAESVQLVFDRATRTTSPSYFLGPCIWV